MQRPPQRRRRTGGTGPPGPDCVPRTGTRFALKDTGGREGKGEETNCDSGEGAGGLSLRRRPAESPSARRLLLERQGGQFMVVRGPVGQEDRTAIPCVQPTQGLRGPGAERGRTGRGEGQTDTRLQMQPPRPGAASPPSHLGTSHLGTSHLGTAQPGKTPRIWGRRGKHGGPTRLDTRLSHASPHTAELTFSQGCGDVVRNRPHGRGETSLERFSRNEATRSPSSERSEFREKPTMK